LSPIIFYIGGADDNSAASCAWSENIDPEFADDDADGGKKHQYGEDDAAADDEVRHIMQHKMDNIRG
jgi:hypothetical protein